MKNKQKEGTPVTHEEVGVFVLTFMIIAIVTLFFKFTYDTGYSDGYSRGLEVHYNHNMCGHSEFINDVNDYIMSAPYYEITK